MTDSTRITPPTYPARPINGGPLNRPMPKPGDWAYEPKYNEWRTLIHVPTGTMFNRHNEPFSIAAEFSPALERLKSSPFEWLDCGANERRHDAGRCSLIVFDAPLVPGSYEVRRRLIEKNFTRLWPKYLPVEDAVYCSFSLPMNAEAALGFYELLRSLNKQFGFDFYEGIVAKRIDAAYPLQLISGEQETPAWVKHRWAY